MIQINYMHFSEFYICLMKTFPIALKKCSLRLSLYFLLVSLAFYILLVLVGIISILLYYFGKIFSMYLHYFVFRRLLYDE